VVLLHGFPQPNTSWDAVITRLTAHGYRCLAPNQRGYSPGARPLRRRDYRMSELVDDALALIDGCGADRVHLVGHDWGAAVGWGVALRQTGRLASFSAISIPHPVAFLRAIPTSRQGLASWYMYVAQLPRLPERLLLGRDGRGTRIAGALLRSGQSAERAERDTLAMLEPGALTAALNWYRAMLLSDSDEIKHRVRVPTMYIWSDGDTAITAKPAYDTAKYVAGPYRFETIRGASHWLPDEEPDTVADLLLEWFAAHPV
jgi:pimeloyl-ACP methyl ester carboxylesterase